MVPSSQYAPKPDPQMIPIVGLNGILSVKNFAVSKNSS